MRRREGRDELGARHPHLAAEEAGVVVSRVARVCMQLWPLKKCFAQRVVPQVLERHVRSFSRTSDVPS
jgi:hypothetical protein